jgi:hypothetical protein
MSIKISPPTDQVIRRRDYDNSEPECSFKLDVADALILPHIEFETPQNSERAGAGTSTQAHRVYWYATVICISTRALNGVIGEARLLSLGQRSASMLHRYIDTGTTTSGWCSTVYARAGDLGGQRAPGARLAVVLASIC